jgi:6-phosphofructokinase 1
LADRACQALAKAVGRAGERVRVVAAPVSIEDDFAFTDSSIGYQTAMADAVQFILRVHSEASACQQLAIVVLPGRHSGALILNAAHASGEVDYALLPETLEAAKTTEDEELTHAAELLARRCHAKRHALAVLSAGGPEGTPDPSAPLRARPVVERFLDILRARLKRRFGSSESPSPQLVVRTAHTVGNGEILPYDINLGKVTGKLMVDAALSGLGRCVVSQWRGQFVAVPMGLAVGRPKTVDLASYCPRTMSEKYLLTPIPTGPADEASVVGEEFG